MGAESIRAKIQVQYTLRNTFWCKDYKSGIDIFLHEVQNVNEILLKEMETYSSFQTECWTPFLKSLNHLNDSVVVPSQGHNPLIFNLLTHFEDLDIEGDVIFNCTSPLRSLLSETGKYYRSANDDLNSEYENFIKAFIELKETLIDCEKKADTISCRLSLEQEPSHGEQGEVTICMGASEESRNLPIFNVSYPFELDEKLIFPDEGNFLQFLERLKRMVPVEKRIISIPGLANEGFQGKLVMNELKKMNARLDLSLIHI